MKEVAKNVFLIPLFPKHMVNAYIIDGFLVDAGIRSSEKKLLKAINQVGREKIEAHVLTHAHPDHQGASAAICQQLNIPLWCGQGDVAAMESGLASEEPENFIIRFQQRFWTGPAYPVARSLHEGDQVGSFTVLETPGHSPGHIVFWREEDGVLIAGDVLGNANLLTTMTGLREPPEIFTSDVAENRKSIRKVAKLQPKIICFGHGPVLHNSNQLNQLVAALPG
ncbi:MAG: MBL fold metallo-hydrolase [Ardenticatenaceae bacterium]|nr:MBL fold metallo-hydrolase [Anaerolineales bacterium]MCB8939643.1 MBL fold metallo-hydrolase [Ardenticatenaceae bacterium]MCB8974932.1 MBL fold metallo-hydrolase [Ardenticatenaceae bacterium]